MNTPQNIDYILVLGISIYASVYILCYSELCHMASETLTLTVFEMLQGSRLEWWGPFLILGKRH